MAEMLALVASTGSACHSGRGYRAVIRVAHVTNQMWTLDPDFEKGEANGTADALVVVSRIVTRLV